MATYYGSIFWSDICQINAKSVHVRPKNALAQYMCV